MSSIEKYISPFIAQQFPAFYNAQGPNFIAFVKAYYEWLEQSNNTIFHARSLIDYNDIDRTADSFIEDFKYQFIQSLPQNTLANKRLLIKHIIDLYRAKGSPRAVELLFRMVFGEDIDLYVPNEYIFKPSDNIWKIPQYIEVTSHPNINQLAGTQIQNVGNTAFGVVDTVSSKIINGRTVNILEITNLRGDFTIGDGVYQTNGTAITLVNPIRITGSLTAVAISDGGRDYAVGDILNIAGSGAEGKARVSSISDTFTGALTYTIADGGSGYTTNAVITVKTTLNLNISGLLGDISFNDSIVDSITNANGTVVFANSSLVQLIDFSTPSSFIVGDKIIGPSGNATITRVSGGVGSGGSFKIGSLSNKENITFNNTIIDLYLALELDSFANTFDITVTGISGTFTANDTVTSSANVLYLEGFTSTVNTIANGESLSNSSLGIANLYVYRSDGALIFCTGPEADITNANLVSGTILISNTTSSIFELIHTPTKETATANAIVVSANATTVSVKTANGYFIETSTLTDANTGATATIADVIRLTDWDFEGSVVTLDNLDSLIANSLPLTTLEVGTISSLTQINPGSGYLSTPYISVIEPEIAALYLLDSELTQKGNNAIITSVITGGNGTITGVEVINSGYGYYDNEGLTLTSNSNPNLVSGISIVYRSGKGEGRWLNRKSFASDIMYLQDGLFYQNYSYQIIAQRMLSSYENLVRELVHPSGVALFGAYRSIDYIVDEQDVISESSIIQQ